MALGCPADNDYMLCSALLGFSYNHQTKLFDFRAMPSISIGHIISLVVIMAAEQKDYIKKKKKDIFFSTLFPFPACNPICLYPSLSIFLLLRDRNVPPQK